MSEFCKNCIEKGMGLKKGDKYYKDWLVKDGGICECCGYDYIKESNSAKEKQ